MERRRSLIVIERAHDDGFGVYAPDVPGCVGLGATIRESITSFSESLELWVEETINDEGEVPQSGSQPAFVEVEVPIDDDTPRAYVLAHGARGTRTQVCSRYGSVVVRHRDHGTVRTLSS